MSGIKEIAAGNGAEYIDLWLTLAGADGKTQERVYQRRSSS